MTNQFAKALLAPTGLNLKPGDNVGLLLPNLPEYLPVIYGAMMAGIRVTFANPLYTPGTLIA